MKAMNKFCTRAARILAAAGAALLLLGVCAPAPRAWATAAATAQSIVIAGTSSQHWSYGQFDVSQSGWITANSRDNWGTATVPYSVLPDRWLACILHSFAAGHFVEVVWMWDSNL